MAERGAHRKNSQEAEGGADMKGSRLAAGRRIIARWASLPGKVCRRVSRKMASLVWNRRKETAPEELAASYRERLAFRGDQYRQWIREREPALWQQWERALGCAPKQGLRKRSCMVIGYGQLAGVTDLAQIAGPGAADQLFLFAENPKDLDERAVACVEDWFGTQTAARLLYGAEDHKRGEERVFPWFKPCFSPDTLLGFFYFGSYFAVDGPWAMQTQLSGYEDARLNLYDFVLRLLLPYYERERLAVHDRRYAEIVCTDLVLYHRSGAAGFRASDALRHIGEIHGETNPEFWGYEKEYIGCKQALVNSICGGSEVCRTTHEDVWTVIPAPNNQTEDGGPLVSVVIPSKDHPKLLKKCIGSFVERTSLPRLRETVEFIVVDNGSGEENREAIREFLASAGILYHYLYRPMPFNFSVMCNMGAKQARGTYVLLLNDDIEIIEESWLRILLGQARMPGTGAVGAKLLYPKGRRIQHIGVTNMAAGPSHKLTAFPDSGCYYYGHNTVSYNMIAVTGACLLVKRSVYEEAGGLDEEMAVTYNDVDFCFTLTEAGLRNVVRNDAVLLHHESVSRGSDGESAEKWQRLLEEKARLYRKHPVFQEHDPYYSSQLAGDVSDYRICCGSPDEQPLPAAAPRRLDKKRDLKRMRFCPVELTIDRIKPRKKICPEDPDILEAEGWCLMQGWDNCLLERFLILEAEQGDFYYQFPVQEQFRPDVAAALPQQKNIELSGFLCAIAAEDIVPGSYSVGMLCRSLCSGKLFYGRSSERLQV